MTSIGDIKMKSIDHYLQLGQLTSTMPTAAKDTSLAERQPLFRPILGRDFSDPSPNSFQRVIPLKHYRVAASPTTNCKSNQ